MRILEFVVFLMLFGALGFGAYVFWLNFPGETLEYKPFTAQVISNAPEAGSNPSGEGTQFYPNMRFPSRSISYRLESVCPQKRWEDVERAFEIISEKTVLEFYESKENPEIRILCSQIAPEPKQEGHFIAGEGGPTEIINTTNYAIILSGNISLYREEKCEEPKIAIHEILHALGFDHYNNSQSIMNPVTGCMQEIDSYIIEEINRIYKTNSLPDLIIDSVSANKTGRYLNFEINVSNQGLADAENAELEVYNSDGKAANFTLGKIEMGMKKMLSVQNIKLSGSSEQIIIVVNLDEMELDKQNNRAELSF